jgi:hypothetical protein
LLSQLFINNEWVDSKQSEKLDVVDPRTGQVIKQIANAGTANVWHTQLGTAGNISQQCCPALSRQVPPNGDSPPPLHPAPCPTQRRQLPPPHPQRSQTASCGHSASTSTSTLWKTILKGFAPCRKRHGRSWWLRAIGTST